MITISRDLGYCHAFEVNEEIEADQVRTELLDKDGRVIEVPENGISVHVEKNIVSVMLKELFSFTTINGEYKLLIHYPEGLQSIEFRVA